MWKSAKNKKALLRQEKIQKNTEVIDWQSLKKGNANDNKLSKGNTFGGI